MTKNQEKFNKLTNLISNINIRLQYGLDLNSIIDDLRNTNYDLVNLIELMKEEIEIDWT